MDKQTPKRLVRDAATGEFRFVDDTRTPEQRQADMLRRTREVKAKARAYGNEV